MVIFSRHLRGARPLWDVIRCLRSFLATNTGYRLSSLRDAFPQTCHLRLFHTFDLSRNYAMPREVFAQQIFGQDEE